MSQKQESEKQLPQSPEIETSVLSAFLTDFNSEYIDEFGFLTPDHFCLRSHRMIFEAIVELQNKKTKVDLFTVQELLKTRGRLDGVGGYHYLSKVASFGYIGNKGQHAERLRESFKLRRMIEIGTSYASKAYEAHDAKDLIHGCEAALFQLSIDNTSNSNELPKSNEVLKKRVQERREGRKVFGISSGLKAFDEPTGGFRPGEYYTIAALPGFGKTSWGEERALYASIFNGVPTAFVSLEMPVDRLHERMACRLSGVSLWRYLNNFATSEELDRFDAARERVFRSELKVICPVDMTGPELRSIIRRFKRQYGTQLFVIDYLQKMKSSRHFEDKSVIKEASTCIADAVKESEVAAIVISQMNREFAKDSRPRMCHLAESAQIERDSDFIGFLWSKAERGNTSENSKHEVVFTIEKNRDGPAGFDEKLFWDGSLLSFKDSEEDKVLAEYSGEYYENNKS